MDAVLKQAGNLARASLRGQIDPADDLDTMIAKADLVLTESKPTRKGKQRRGRLLDVSDPEARREVSLIYRSAREDERRALLEDFGRAVAPFVKPEIKITQEIGYENYVAPGES